MYFHAISYICFCYLISSLSRCLCHLIPVYVSTDWIFSRRSLLDSSTATEQLLRHTSFPPWDLHLRTWWGTNAFFSVLQMSHFFSSMWCVCVCVCGCVCLCGSVTRFICLGGKRLHVMCKISRIKSGTEAVMIQRAVAFLLCCRFFVFTLTRLLFWLFSGVYNVTRGSEPC